MWEYRNHVLYHINGGVHKLEQEAIDKAIQGKFMIGLDSIDNSIAGFFWGNINQVLTMHTNTKMQWLESVWGERNKLRHAKGLESWYKDPLATTFLVRDRAQRKRKREEDFAAL